jgi:hypothetical protein
MAVIVSVAVAPAVAAACHWVELRLVPDIGADSVTVPPLVMLKPPPTTTSPTGHTASTVPLFVKVV